MGKDGSVMVERLVKKTSFSRSFHLRSTDGKCCLLVDFYLWVFLCGFFFKPGPRCRSWCHRTKIQWNVMGTSPRWIGTEKNNTIQLSLGLREVYIFWTGNVFGISSTRILSSLEISSLTGSTTISTQVRVIVGIIIIQSCQILYRDQNLQSRFYPSTSNQQNRI